MIDPPSSRSPRPVNDAARAAAPDASQESVSPAAPPRLAADPTMAEATAGAEAAAPSGDDTRRKARNKARKQAQKQGRTQTPGQASSQSRSAEPEPPPGWLMLGKIVAAQGLQGEVRVYPDSDFPERFLDAGDRWLWAPNPRSPQTLPTPVQLKQGRYLDGKGLYVVKFASVRDRTQAEALVGQYLLVPESDRPPLEAGEFHIIDLIGLPVYDQASQTLVGQVSSLMAAGHDLLEVTPTEGDRKPILIPFVEAIVPVVDLVARRIEITPPAGLIDL